jgi:hypothetical protein
MGKSTTALIVAQTCQALWDELHSTQHTHATSNERATAEYY